MTRRVRLLVLILTLIAVAHAGAVATTAQVRDPGAMPQTGTGAIAGALMTTDTPPQPVRHATVTVTGGGLRMQRQTVTDSDGRFVVADLPAGSFRLSVSKPAYLQTIYGATQPGQSGDPIVLAAGQRTRIDLQMPRGAVLAGTVFDPYGRPRAQVRVQVMQYRVQNGQRRLVQAGGGNSTDDRGAYRIYGLPPGDCVIVATPQGQTDARMVTADEVRWAQQGAPNTVTAPANPPPQSGPTMGFSPIYFPGVADVAAATTITLRAGEERAGLDFQLQPVPTATVDGTLLDPDGQPPQQPQVNLIPTERLASGMPQLGVSSEYGQIDRATGKFTIRGVTPGRYTIYARSTIPPVAPVAPPPASPGAGPAPPGAGTSAPRPVPAQPRLLWATGEIDVDGRNISNLSIALQPALTLSGRVVFEGSNLPRPDPARVRVGLSPLDPNPYFQSYPNALADADGTFAVHEALPGRYRLSASLASAPGSPGGSWLAKSIVIGGQEMIDSGFEIGSTDVTGATVTFTDLRTVLTGSLVDTAGAPAKGLLVLVFSTDRAFWTPQSRRVRLVKPDQEGKFRLDPWPPGEYYMVAIAEGDQLDFTDRGAMEQIAAAAMTTITLKEGETKVQDLRVAK